MSGDHDDVPCKPTCLICTDDSPPEKWSGPYHAYRWSPDAPGGICKPEEQLR